LPEEPSDGLEGYQRLVKETRAKMISPKTERENPRGHHKTSKFGGRAGKLPDLVKGRHVPTLALIDPGETSIKRVSLGSEVLNIAKTTPCHQERFFNIAEILEDKFKRGGFLDVLREELCKAKAEALELCTRPRVISGGDDSTASLAIWLIFKALQANNRRAEEGMKDTGNGFIWTDEELKASFPAIAHMPLGNKNSFAEALGWGYVMPGSTNGCLACIRGTRRTRKRRYDALLRWIGAVIDPKTSLSNFDVWGVMPGFGQDRVNFKLAELGAKPGRTPKTKVKGKTQISLKPPSNPIPWFVLAYWSAGFEAYLNARCKANRRSTPFRNRLERLRQIFGILTERVPAQMKKKTNGIKIECAGARGGEGGGGHSKAQSYFPPRAGRKSTSHFWSKGSRYREVGFVNCSCRHLRGADRAPLHRRLCFGSRRRPIRFNDGMLDMYRFRFKSYFKNPGRRMQTDKRKDVNLIFEAGMGKGFFMQFDGESRYAFSPKGEQFHVAIRKVFNLPVVVGPSPFEKVALDGKEVSFQIGGDTPEAQEQVKVRLLKSLRGELEAEMNATEAELSAANVPVHDPPHDQKLGQPVPKDPKMTHPW
jgi:hypothetical protein